MSRFHHTIQQIKPLNTQAMEEAQKRLDYLLKPQGSLGKLESIAKQLSGITGNIHNHIEKKAIVIGCSDNGVYEEGIASFPQSVSTLIAGTMVTGLSGVAVLANHAGAILKVIDVGLVTDVENDAIINRKIRRGTHNIRKTAAMTKDEAIRAIEIGIEETNVLIGSGYNLIGTGEVGIGNTTTSSAILYALTGCDIDSVVGRGAGLTDEAFANKKKVVMDAVQINKPDRNDPIDVLSKLGGFDIACMTGVYLACAAKKIPVVIDGFISGVAAVLAHKIHSDTVGYMISSHGTEEPGGKIINTLLGLEPMLYMNMRLGEGTGAALAFSIIEAATAMMNNMGTFGDIGL